MIVGVSDLVNLKAKVEAARLEFLEIGTFGSGQGLEVSVGAEALTWTNSELVEAFENSIPKAIAG